MSSENIEWSNLSTSGEFVPASTERWAWRHFADAGARVFWRVQGAPLWTPAVPATILPGSMASEDRGDDGDFDDRG